MILTADEIGDLIAGGGFDSRYVALGAICVKQPVGQRTRSGGLGNVGVQRGVGIGIGLGLILGCVFQAEVDEGLLVGDLGGHLLGGGLGVSHRLVGLGLLLFVGQLGLAVGRFGVAGAVEGEVAEGDTVVIVGICGILRIDLLIGIGQAVGNGAGIGLRDGVDAHVLGVALLIAAGAVLTGEEGINVAVAVDGGNAAHLVKLTLDGGFLILGQGKAVCDGLVIDGVGGSGVGQTGGDEVVGPALAGLFVVGLLAQSGVLVEEQAQVAAVVGGKVAVGVAAEVIDHSGRQLVFTDSRGGRMFCKEAGRQHGKENDHGDGKHCNHNAQSGLTALAHALFLVLDFRSDVLSLLLALVFFTRCTHLGIIPLIVRCTKFAPVGDSTHIILKNTVGFKSGFHIYGKKHKRRKPDKKRQALKSAPAAIPRWPCSPNYNLHETAGGSPLRCLTASNVRRNV